MAMPRKPKSPRGFAETKSRYGTARVGGALAKGGARRKRRLPEPETLPDGTVRYFLVLGPKGRVLLPAEMRAAMGLEEGDVITAWLREGEARMHSHRHGLRKIQDEARSMASAGVHASEELIAERRAENAKDEKETSRSSRRARKSRK